MFRNVFWAVIAALSVHGICFFLFFRFYKAKMKSVKELSFHDIMLFVYDYLGMFIRGSVFFVLIICALNFTFTFLFTLFSSLNW